MSAPSPVAPQALRRAMAEAMFLLPHSELFQSPQIPGINGYVAPESASYFSLIRLDTPPRPSDDFGRLVQRVVDRLGVLGKGGRWLVGPNDSTGNALLAQKLIQAGMTLDFDLAGVALSDLTGPTDPAPGVEVREVGAVEMARHVDLVEESHKISRARAERALLKYSPERRDTRLRNYIATVDGKAAAFGFSLYLPDQPIVNLRLAGTLERYRRRGAYQALVARRLADAAGDGVQAAVVTALPDTSLAILLRFGFEEICRFSIYSWEVA